MTINHIQICLSLPVVLSTQQKGVNINEAFLELENN